MYKRTMNKHSFLHILQTDPARFSFLAFPAMEGRPVPQKGEKLSMIPYDTYITQNKGKLLPKIEEITVGKAHANSRKFI